jgi:DNA-binding transcriptional MocR family regulator
VQGWDDEEALVLHLLAQGVLVHPGYFFNSEQRTDMAHIMISCLTKSEQLEAGLRKVVGVL